MTTSYTGHPGSYSERTLDDLRRLTSSVETGRIHDMQTHFQKVAHQVDDVIGELRALQKDLPTWWSGQASEAALTAFGHVVSHAESTHQVASGASAALRTCALVVGEQQATMDLVPDVAKPAPMAMQFGDEVAAYISYEDARGRGVRVVQGVAAQLVETKAQLGALAANVGENFQAVTGAASQAESFNIGENFQAVTGAASEAEGFNMDHTTSASYQYRMPQEANSVVTGIGPTTTVHAVLTSQPLVLEARNARRSLVGSPSALPWVPQARMPNRPQDTVVSLAASNLSPYENIAQEIDPKRASSGKLPAGSPQRDGSNDAVRKANVRSKSIDVSFNDDQHQTNGGSTSSIGKDKAAVFEPQAAEAETRGSEMPLQSPFVAGARVHSQSEKEATKCPAYLKSQKPWITNRPLAPSDGLLTAEWAESL